MHFLIITITLAKLAGLTSPGVLEQKVSRKSGYWINIYLPVSVVIHAVDFWFPFKLIYFLMVVHYLPK